MRKQAPSSELSDDDKDLKEDAKFTQLNALLDNESALADKGMSRQLLARQTEKTARYKEKTGCFDCFCFWKRKKDKPNDSSPTAKDVPYRKLQ